MLKQEKIYLVITGHGGQIMAAQFSPNGERIATASQDTTARVWDANTGVELLELRGHVGPVDGLVYTSDGSRIVTASEDTTARIWDASWLNKRGQELVNDVCESRLIGNNQVFTNEDVVDPILAGLAGSNPCDRSGPLSLKYWATLARKAWRRLAGPSG